VKGEGESKRRHKKGDARRCKDQTEKRRIEDILRVMSMITIRMSFCEFNISF
jgi:hypothetical protein